VLAVLAHRSATFPGDLAFTRALQSHRSPAVAGLMVAVSWLGFLPQVAVLGGMVVVALFLRGLRWEAAALLFAACGAGLMAVVKLIVGRPRPSADLVQVFGWLSTSSFPSGHAMQFTAFGGFLGFLVYSWLEPSWGRRVLLIALAALIVLVGPSRIYLGQHWLSDVIGGYLLGSLWLALTLQFYRWGKPRFFVNGPGVGPPPAQPTS
jgi:undecaprenyl-diphosphatase